jgi:hypothetical protein
MSTPFLDPALFDDPRLTHPRRCFKAVGSKKVNGPHQRTKTRERTVWINASRLTVATRVARRELSLGSYKLSFIHETTWDEYARSLPREYVSFATAAPSTDPLHASTHTSSKFD